MKNTKTILNFLMGLLIFSCSNPQIKETDHGIILEIKQKKKLDTRKICIDILSDDIVHVSATPEKEFVKDSSLIILPQRNSVEYTIDDFGDSILLKTKKLNILISKQDGQVIFKNKKNEIILSEKENGGREFTPIIVEGTKGYTIQQMFESPSDEAFYGLGQHQSDEFNYKDKSEELFQYNTKVSVPFVVSNKNYGLLWDSYSLSRFGDSRPYMQLNKAFKLYNKESINGGLTGTYESGVDDIETIVRQEDSLFFEDIKAIKGLPKDFSLKKASVLYEGEIEAPNDGEYKFILYYAGYVKVFLGNELVVPERWRTAWNPNTYKFTKQLKKGEKIPLRVEWKPDGDISYIGLRTLPPKTSDEKDTQVWWSEMNKNLDYYFIHGESYDEIIKGYRNLTGKSQVMPKWAMGFWQSRERYKTQEEILTTLKEFRNQQIPIDNIVLDWNHWQEDAWGSHEFDTARFPSPKTMVDSIHALNGKIMISVWPKFYITTEHYKEFDKNGWMYQRAVEDSIRDWVGPGYVGSFYDAYSPEARKLFWDQIREHYYTLGIDAWWMDASEPNILDCTDMEYRKALCGPTALGPSTEYFNTYALMNAEAIYNGQRDVAPNKRVFLLTRSGFAGLQSYSTATWSGDIGTRWEDMKAQISAGLNFSLSGIPYWTMDIGGFCVEDRYVNGQIEFNNKGIENNDLEEWRELNTRWYQFGTFVPLFRSHGQYPYREPWNIASKGHPAYESITYYINLRYRLMPYIYTMAGMTYFNDYTIMRALVMDFSNDEKVTDVSDQYMFGPSIMICPVYNYKERKREVYFPKENNWYDLYSGKYFQGGIKQTIAAPYEQIPLFIKEGAIIPIGPDIQYTQEKPADPLILYVYKGKDGIFNLYEDEGSNYNYEQGAFSIIPFIYNDNEESLTIGNRKGEFEGMLKNRTFIIKIVSKENPEPLNFIAKGIVINYNGEEQTIELK